jgi:hypothetical protein
MKFFTCLFKRSISTVRHFHFYYTRQKITFYKLMSFTNIANRKKTGR